MHTIKPIDVEAVRTAAIETGGILTVEEHTIQGGLGSAIAEVALELDTRPRKFKRLGLNDEFSTVVGSQQYLRQHFGIDGAGIAATVRQLLQ